MKDITVLLSTYKRCHELSKTLSAFTQLDVSGINWEVIIIDNACHRETQKLVEQYKDKLPLQLYVDPTRGKNAALNNHLKYIQGKIVILTDDDIIPEKNWLKEYISKIQQWPECFVFGGRVLPQWPNGKKHFKELKEDFIKIAYTIADWDIPEGEMKPEHVWGPNMAVRKEIFDKGYTFNIDVGPEGKNFIMGGETEFTCRLAKDGFIPIYLPSVLVYHQIREEQLTPQWLYGRAFRYGRAMIFHDDESQANLLFGAPRYQYRKLITLKITRLFSLLTFNLPEYYNLGIRCHLLAGMIFQSRIQHRQQSISI